MPIGYDSCMDFEERISIRIGEERDIGAIAQTIYDYQADKTLQQFSERVTEFIAENSDPEAFGKIFVAEFDDEIVGHGRLFYYDPKEITVKFLSPGGWYLNGSIVREKFRRKGVASALAKFREGFVRFQKKKNQELFSIVAGDNESSIAYHLANDYQEFMRSSGFLNIKLECGEGILFRKVL